MPFLSSIPEVLPQETATKVLFMLFFHGCPAATTSVQPPVRSKLIRGLVSFRLLWISFSKSGIMSDRIHWSFTMKEKPGESESAFVTKSRRLLLRERGRFFLRALTKKRWTCNDALLSRPFSMI